MKTTLQSVPLLAILSLIALIGNSVASRSLPLEATPGMLVLMGIALGGSLLFTLLPFKGIPAIVYVSLLGILVTAPFSPLSPLLVPLVAKVNFLALATPVLGCAGISLASEAEQMKKQGFKMFLVSLIVFTGTFLGSAVLAELLLNLTSYRP